MADKKIERKRMLVNTVIQGRILTRVAAYWIVYHIVLWHTLFIFQYFQYRVEVFNGADMVPFTELYGTFCLKYYPIVFSALACAPLFLFDVFKMTFRIAGPLYRFEQTLKSMRAGERIEKVTLRDHDLLTEFRDEFNLFLKHYNELRYGHQLPVATAPAATTTADAIPVEQSILADIEELKNSVGAQVASEAAST